MKTLTISALAVLLCGCNGAAERKAAEQERRIGQLEAKLQEIYGVLEKVADRNEHTLVLLTNSASISDRIEQSTAVFHRRVLDFMEGEERRVTDIVSVELERLLQARAAALAKGRVPAPVAKAAEATRDGVPVSIWNEIAATAAKKWPGNFRMQDFDIREQVEAWQKLNR